MRRKFLILPLFIALLLVVAFGTGMRCIVATATHVTDANSFDATADSAWDWGGDCAVTPGDEYHVRLLGIEAPTGDECYAQEATDYVKNLVEGNRVCLVRDIGCKDSNGDLLAYVGVDTNSSWRGCDLFLNADLVWNGYARAVTPTPDTSLQASCDGDAHNQHGRPIFSPPNTLMQRLLEMLQCQAYREGRGMWGACPDLPAPEGCEVQLTPTPGPTATPTPAESTETPEAARSQNCCKTCRLGKACGDECIPRYQTCDQPPGCACDAR